MITRQNHKIIPMDAAPNTPNHFESLLSQAREYADSRIALLKLKSADKISDSASDVGSALVIMLFIVIFLLVLTVGLALLIGEWLGKTYDGFFVMAGVYGIAGLIAITNRKKLIKMPICNFVINKILNDTE